MTPLTSKALVVAGSLALVSGGSILAGQMGVFSPPPKNIKERLISEGYQILSSSNSAGTDIFDKYKNNDNRWKFKEDGINSSSSSTDIQKLKDKCVEAMEKEPNNAEEYYKAAKGCSVPRKLESFIPSSSLLNTVGDDTKDRPKWQKILSDFKAAKIGSSGYVMAGITIQNPNDNSKEAENIRAIKDACNMRRNKLHYALDFEKTLEEVKKGCSRT